MDNLNKQERQKKYNELFWEPAEEFFGEEDEVSAQGDTGSQPSGQAEIHDAPVRPVRACREDANRKG